MYVLEEVIWSRVLGWDPAGFLWRSFEDLILAVELLVQLEDGSHVATSTIYGIHMGGGGER
jgi:hypothetical protein